MAIEKRRLIMKSLKKKSMKIPVDLAKLLVAEPEDLREPDKYEEIHKIAKTLLKVLLANN